MTASGATIVEVAAYREAERIRGAVSAQGAVLQGLPPCNTGQPCDLATSQRDFYCGETQCAGYLCQAPRKKMVPGGGCQGR